MSIRWPSAVCLLAAGAIVHGGELVPDFRLPDVNFNSPRRTSVSPRDYLFQVSGFYFASAGCSYCRSQFQYLAQVQAELRTEKLDAAVDIVGINRGTDSGYNSQVTAMSSLCWLQDTLTKSVWVAWGAEFRDLHIVNPLGERVAVFNATYNDLAKPENREEVKRLIRQAAAMPDLDGDRLPDQWETKWFGDLATAAHEDTDGDGADAWQEFMFGSDPKDAESQPGYRLKVSQGRLSATFRRWGGGWADYQFDAGADLGTWSTAGSVLTKPLSPGLLYNGTGYAEVTYTLARPMAATPASFLRLRAGPRTVALP